MTARAHATAGFADTSTTTLSATLRELTADLPPSKRTVPALLKRSAEKFGNAPLLSINGLTWSHRVAATAVAGRAGALKAANIERGDKVAIMCGNKIELLETFLANGWIGAASVPINTASMGPQIQYFLANSEAKLLVIDSEYLDRLDSVNLSATKLELIWVVASSSDGMPVGANMLQGVPCTAFPAAATPVDPVEVLPGETLAVLYTSGTTGPAQRRYVPSRTVLLVGCAQRRRPGHYAKRCALHHASLIPHQCIAHLCSGLPVGRQRRVSKTFFRVGILAVHERLRRNRSVFGWAQWRLFCWPNL